MQVTFTALIAEPNTDLFLQEKPSIKNLCLDHLQQIIRDVRHIGRYLFRVL